jgi:dTDP-4-amino-4,6-dideoxygalactose transaminase
MVANALGVPTSWVHLTNSCTSALAAAYALGPKPDLHAVPLLTYSATAASALLQRIDVQLMDVDDDGWPALGQRSPTVGVDLWGRAYPLAYTGRPLILDAAHRFAGPEHKELVENGTLVCYSFGPQKECAVPQGGALVWREMEKQSVRDEVAAFLHYGQHERVPTERGGLCGWMPEPTAALLVPQLAVRRREWCMKRRQEILETYENFLGKLLLTKPGEASGHVAVIALPDEGTTKCVQTQMRRAEIEVGVHYPIHPEYRSTNAYALSKRILTLPCHLAMNGKDAAKIARAVLTA